MELTKYTYLGIVFLTFIVPLFFSFNRKIGFWKNWIYLFPAILITAIPFLLWDINFAEAGIWSFNTDYTIGIIIKGLPLEEWLYFVSVPYACMFIYEAIKVHFPNFGKANLFVAISLVLVLVFAILAFMNQEKTYTFLNFLFAGVFLAYIIFRNQFKAHIAHFYLAFAGSILPFLLINGLLTYLPIVEHNSDHMLSLFFISIPIEDFAYLFLLLLMNTSIYEAIKTHWTAKKNQG